MIKSILINIYKLETFIYIFLSHVMWPEAMDNGQDHPSGNVEGKKSHRRPKKQWIDNVREWTGKGIDKLKEIVHNRKKLRTFCFDVTRPYGSTG